MVVSALVLLVCQVPAWWFALPVSIIVSREIAVSALREWMAEQGKRASVQVSKLGKYKTALQMISIFFLLESASVPVAGDVDLTLLIGLHRPTVFVAGLILLHISTILTLISGYQYFKASGLLNLKNFITDNNNDDEIDADKTMETNTHEATALKND
jgi:CDP-diacylglycerol--glycerol-3-phosphate 3-phosphatidyltransferase